MTVAIDDAPRVREGRAQARVAGRDGRELMAVDNQQNAAEEFKPEHRRQTGANRRFAHRPSRGRVVVAGDNADRRDARQTLHDRVRAEIAGVDNQIHASEPLDKWRRQLAMTVRQQSNAAGHDITAVLGLQADCER